MPVCAARLLRIDVAARGGVLPRRQDLPEEAFLSSAQLRRIERGARRGFDLAGLKEALERVSAPPVVVWQGDYVCTCTCKLKCHYMCEVLL